MCEAMIVFLSVPVSIEPYPFKAKPFPVPHMGGISDEEGLKVYDNSPPNWNEKAREKLGLTKKTGTSVLSPVSVCVDHVFQITHVFMFRSSGVHADILQNAHHTHTQCILA